MTANTSSLSSSIFQVRSTIYGYETTMENTRRKREASGLLEVASSSDGEEEEMSDNYEELLEHLTLTTSDTNNERKEGTFNVVRRKVN